MKGYFKNLNENAVLIEQQIFKPINHKKMDPTKTEVTQDELECKMKNEKFNNLTKCKRTASRGRGDIFITKTD